MKSETALTPQSNSQLPKTTSDLKAVLQYVADITGEAKKAAEENPIVTSTGKPKSELKGATKITNKLKEEGIEANKRGIVSKPNMEGGLKNNDLNNAANSGLKILELSENQSKSLSEDTTGSKALPPKPQKTK